MLGTPTSKYSPLTPSLPCPGQRLTGNQATIVHPPDQVLSVGGDQANDYQDPYLLHPAPVHGSEWRALHPSDPKGPSCSLTSVRIGPALTAAPSEDTITQVLRMPGYLGIYQEELMGYAPRHDALPLPEYDRIPAADTATSRHAATPVSCGGHVALPRYGSNVTAPEQPFDASAIKESPRNRSDSGIPSRAPYPDKTYRKVSSRGAASSKIRAPDYASPP